ncbi:MAG TPA: RNA polymerase sigma factor, partial [Candidatus Xenobia bacterium]
ALPGFRGESNLQTFLLRLARNKCVSHLRKTTARKRGRETVTVSIDDAARGDGPLPPRILAVDPTPRPDEALLRQEEVHRLLGCMTELSSDCQTVLRLRYAQDMAYDDICRHLGLPLGTVCSRLKRCIDRLRILMDRE